MKAFWYNENRKNIIGLEITMIVKMYVASRYENFARKNIFPQKN